MTLADRIVVMNDRRIQQVGAPDGDLQPAGEHLRRAVRRLAGDDPAAGAAGRRRRVRDARSSATDRSCRPASPAPACPSGELRLGLRPEAVRVSRRERRRPRPRSSWSSGSASARSSTRVSPTASRSPPRTRRTAASQIGDEVPLAIDGSRGARVRPGRHRLSPGRPHDRRSGTGAGCCSSRRSCALCAHPDLPAAARTVAQPQPGRPVRRRAISSASAIMRGCCTIRCSAPRWSTRSKSR